MAFSPDGRTVLTGSEDNTARLWSVQPPREADTASIDLWLAVVTGLALDEHDAGQMLVGNIWRTSRERLLQHGTRRRSKNKCHMKAINAVNSARQRGNQERVFELRNLARSKSASRLSIAHQEGVRCQFFRGSTILPTLSVKFPALARQPDQEVEVVRRRFRQPIARADAPTPACQKLASKLKINVPHINLPHPQRVENKPGNAVFVGRQIA